MFKVVKGLAPTIINDLFPLKVTNNYKLRHKLFLRYLEMIIIYLLFISNLFIVDNFR